MITSFVKEVIVELYNNAYTFYLSKEMESVCQTLDASKDADPEYWDKYPNSSTMWREQMEAEASDNAHERALSQFYADPYSGRRIGLAALCSSHEELENICLGR